MPSWCRNTLDVSGAPADLEIFRAAVCRPVDGPDKAIPFSLEAVLPMPEILARTARGYQEFTTAEGKIIKCRAWYGDGIEARPFTKTEAAMVAATGATDWYDWSLQNWGVSSDATAGAISGSPSTGHLRYEFTTARDCPRPVIDHLVERFPMLTQVWVADGDGWQETFIHEAEIVVAKA